MSEGGLVLSVVVLTAILMVDVLYEILKIVQNRPKKVRKNYNDYNERR
jgi:hypothetical protein